MVSLESHVSMTMRPLVFATSNPHKIHEVRQMVSNTDIQLLDLKDIGCEIEIPETSETVEGNAIQKAQFVFEHYAMDCFAEDTGLFVDALNGEPGVHSARYAGPKREAKANMKKLLKKLKNHMDRKAHFLTVIACILEGKIHLFRGRVDGTIISETQGDKGFGYDPVFRPSGHMETFGQLDEQAKNKISHRAKAMESFIAFLRELNKK